MHKYVSLLLVNRNNRILSVCFYHVEIYDCFTYCKVKGENGMFDMQ